LITLCGDYTERVNVLSVTFLWAVLKDRFASIDTLFE